MGPRQRVRVCAFLTWTNPGLYTGFPFRCALDPVLAGDPDLIRLSLLHLMQPAVTLATIPLALITRVTRAELVAAGLLDHARTQPPPNLKQSLRTAYT